MIARLTFFLACVAALGFLASGFTVAVYTNYGGWTAGGIILAAVTFIGGLYAGAVMASTE